MLLAELKKIEARKRERERKTQDLQKLISRAESGNVLAPNQVTNNTEGVQTPSNTSTNIARRHDRKLHKKKLSSQQRPVRAIETVVSKCQKKKILFPKLIGNNDIFVPLKKLFQTVEWSGIKFPESRGTGVWLRSQRMKLPPGVGQRKTKAIEQELRQMNIGMVHKYLKWTDKTLKLKWKF